MITHKSINKVILREKIRQGEICLGGNARLKIYGSLTCSSGKRMKAESRVFFASEAEATDTGYRPCGHCMRKQYQQWKGTQKQTLVHPQPLALLGPAVTGKCK